MQIRENRLNEIQDPKTSLMLQNATVAFMRATMGANQQLAKLGHSSEFDRFMFSALSIAFGDLVNEGGTAIATWQKSGDKAKRRVVLAFAMGASILVDSSAIDTLFHRIIQARFESSDNEVAAPILLLINRLGNSGYDCLKPVTDLSNQGGSTSANWADSRRVRRKRRGVFRDRYGRVLCRATYSRKMLRRGWPFHAAKYELVRRSL